MKIKKSGKAAKAKHQDSPVFKLNKGGVGKQKNKKDKNGVPQGRVVKTGAVSKLRKDGSRKVLYSLDKVINTPTGTKSLIYSDDSDSEIKKKINQKTSLKQKKMKKVKEESDKPKEKDKTEPENGSENLDLNGPGGLLRKGLKFKSQDSFLRFINMPVKGAKGKKRKVDETNLREAADLEGVENPAFENSVLEDVDSLKAPNRKKKRSSSEENNLNCVDGVHPRFDKNKLKEILSAAEPQLNGKKNNKKSFTEKALDKLTSSRFRYLNEQLYTQTSSESAKMFREDETLFSAYHQGFQQQANQWPSDPLDKIISACLHLPDSAVVVDMGCGEARLSRSINNTVHSFDLVSLAPGVVQCDMSKVPLKNESVDVVVFCLSLMGTNIKDFLQEAARILKYQGILKIAELESRFQGEEENFIKEVEKFGFKSTWTNLKHKYFYFFDFKKVSESKSKKKLPNIELKPCLYKKR